MRIDDIRVYQTTPTSAFQIADANESLLYPNLCQSELTSHLAELLEGGGIIKM